MAPANTLAFQNQQMSIKREMSSTTISISAIAGERRPKKTYDQRTFVMRWTIIIADVRPTCDFGEDR